MFDVRCTVLLVSVPVPWFVRRLYPLLATVALIAVGMLMNVAAAMDLPAVDERWTSWCPKD